MSFFYQKGKVTTTIPWQRPNPDSIVKLLDNIIPKVNAQGLELRIMGGCLLDMNATWDLDLLLTGQIDNQDLEDLLHEMTDFSLNQCSLLLDAGWFSDLVYYRLDENDVWRYNDGPVFKMLNPTIKRSPTSAFYSDALRRPSSIPLTRYLFQGKFEKVVPKEHYSKFVKNNGLKTMLAVDWRKELIDKQSK